MTVEKKIGQREYRLIDIPITEVLDLKFKITRLLGDSADEVFDKVFSSENVPFSAFGPKLFTAISKKIAPGETPALMNEILKNVEVKNTAGKWAVCELNGDFTLHKSELYPVLYFVCWEILKDFFGGEESINKFWDYIKESPMTPDSLPAMKSEA